MSLYGRVVLLNFMFNSISMLFLSFMKILSLVWRKLVSMQRRFLWRVLKEGLRLPRLKGMLFVKVKERKSRSEESYIGKYCLTK